MNTAGGSAADDFIEGGQSVGAERGWAWIAGGWKFALPHLGIFVVIVLVYLVLSIVVGLVPLIGSLAIALVTPVFNGGIMLGCEAMRRGEPLTVGHLFAGFSRHTGPLVALGAIKLVVGLLILVIGIVAAGGALLPFFMSGGEADPEQLAALLTSILLFVLIILALSVPLYMALWFAPALIVLEGLEVMPALKASFNACLKNIVPFLIYGLVLFVLAIVASIPILLGWLLLAPVVFASIYVGYRDVFHADGGTA